MHQPQSAVEFNGMVVAAFVQRRRRALRFGYDSNNGDEVSVVVAGGLSDTDVAAGCMNLVPRNAAIPFKVQWS